MLTTIQHLAQSAHFSEMLAACRALRIEQPHSFDTHLALGSLLSNYGFLAEARSCYERAQSIAPTDLRAQVNLANLARDASEHAEARRLYTELLRQLSDHPVIRRNALTSLEYDPEVPDAERLVQAQAWGAWAIARAGSARPRPALTPLKNRPLRLGYVSADLCQHTVGLFVKDVLKAHDPTRVQVFAYSAGQVKDWVTDEIRAAYTSQAGPITPLDILYGHGAALAAGHHYMAHKTGCTLKTLTQALHTAGFATSAGRRGLRGLDLWVVASKGPMEETTLRELAGKVLPA